MKISGKELRKIISEEVTKYLENTADPEGDAGAGAMGAKTGRSAATKDAQNTDSSKKAASAFAELMSSAAAQQRIQAIATPADFADFVGLLINKVKAIKGDDSEQKLRIGMTLRNLGQQLMGGE